jgi:hypothetical protein
MHKNIYEINPIDQIKSEEYFKTTIYTVDNFFKSPELIVESLVEENAPLWKAEEKPSYNGTHFYDRRHFVVNDYLIPVHDALAKVCGGKPRQSFNNRFSTNFCKLVDHPFNDYKNNYWWPHYDSPGYTAIVYLNDITTAGTNLYVGIGDNVEPDNHEHYAPWKSKSKYYRAKMLEAKYNRLVIFDGGSFLHGMAIEDDTFFNTERMNLVMFLDK